MFTATIVGFGERGKTLAQVIKRHVPEIRRLFACDPDARAQTEARALGLETYASLADCMKSSFPDLVIVTTNPPDHCAAVLTAAQWKVPVLCEKPLALSPHEADAMVEAVTHADIACAVDFETVFSDSFHVLQEELKRDEFGRLIRIDAVDKGRLPAYDLETCMPHFLHVFMELTGSRPVEVFGRVLVDGRRATLADVVRINDIATQYPKRAHDIGMRADSIEATYLMENGVTVRYFLAALDEEYVVLAGRHAKPGSEFMSFTAYGTRGQVKWHQTAMGYVYRKDAPQDTLTSAAWELVYAPSKPDPTWEVPTARLVRDFVEAALQKRQKPRASLLAAQSVVDQVYGIYASHLVGKPVALPLERREHPLR